MYTLYLQRSFSVNKQVSVWPGFKLLCDYIHLITWKREYDDRDLVLIVLMLWLSYSDKYHSR